MKVSTPILAFGCCLFVADASAQNLASYQAMVLSQNPSNYFKLDGSYQSTINSGIILETNGLIVANGAFANDTYRNSASSHAFDSGQGNAYLRYITTPLINGGGTANSNATATGSISFLFRTLTGPNIGGQRWLFDATTTGGMGTSNHNAFALFFENDTDLVNTNSLKLRFGDTTTTILLASNVAYNTWYYFALTYDESRVPNKAIWYLAPAGGPLITGMTTNSGDAVAGEGTGFYLGQRASFGGAFRNPGSGRIDEFAIWARELSYTEISNQFARLPQSPPPNATYQQVVQAQLPKYHFKLDNSFLESIGNTLALSTNGLAGAFTSDALGNANSAYSFSATNDALYITNDLVNGGGPGVNASANGVGTISFQFRMLSDTNYSGERFIFSAPGSEANAVDDNQLGLFIASSADAVNPGSLKLRLGNTTKGNSGSSSADNNIPVAYATNLVPNAWYYFALTYDESRNTPEVNVYFGQAGGTLTVGTMNPANNAVVGNDGWLVLGNKVVTNTIMDNAFRNPGQGAVDEFAIWHDELSLPEIQAQFAAMTPATAPALNITLDGGNVLLSWPSTASASYVLEATNVLDSTTLGGVSWPSAGSATVVGGSYYVTNSVGSGNRFYRLHKP